MEELAGLSIEELSRRCRRGEITPIDVVRSCLDAIEIRDGTVGAFLATAPDEALRRAAALAREGPGERPLFGVPVAVKDNICTRALPTTAASRMLGGYRPPYDATVVERLERAGAVIIGKTNLDEFAMGSSTENSAFQRTTNPWDPSRVPGGSSGGSAAAVAARMVPLALGSDTGGSIRQPAAFCGVVGLKGTYGLVSRYGLIAFASSFDQIGPITGNVRDCAIAMQVIAGHDPRDATTLTGQPPDYGGAVEEGLSGLRVAVPSALGDWEMDGPVRNATARVIAAVEAAGVTVRETELPAVEASIACYYVLANAEASSNLARYDGVRYGRRAPAGSLDELYELTRGGGFGEEVKRRILLGTYVLSAGYYDAYYGKGQRVREMIREGFRRVFDECDLVLFPTAPTTAFRLGERTEDPIAMYRSDIFTTPASVAGIPAVSVPVGFSPEGLPIGLQLLAGPGREAVLLRGARAVECIAGFGDRRPGGSARAAEEGHHG